jgi:ADP-ribose pyrophosphatase YjhB (NUDIX family)
MKAQEAIALLDGLVPDPTQGLPDDVFYYVSRTTPLVNVDLLLKDERGRCLLAWRDDPMAGTGWHVPGGIVRYCETFDARVRKVAQLEIGVDTIEYDSAPAAINEIIRREAKVRGHFISILYRCSLPSSYVPDNSRRDRYDRGFLQWHDVCPPDLLSLQDMYRSFI